MNCDFLEIEKEMQNQRDPQPINPREAPLVRASRHVKPFTRSRCMLTYAKWNPTQLIQLSKVASHNFRVKELEPLVP